MVTFFLRRLVASALVVLTSSFIMYLLVDAAIDPLADLRGSSGANREQLIAQRIAELQLDESVVSRYWSWLKGASGCLYGQCDLGTNWKSHQEVTHLLAGAIANSFKLVMAATVLAIIFGIMVGIVSALRQYTGFDYGVTFLSFLLYSLPVFWVAVLAKTYLAIDFNNFLTDPQIPVWFMVLTAVVFGVTLAAALGGRWLSRIRNFAIVAVVVVAFAVYFNVTDWFLDPHLGIVGTALLSIGIAFLVTTLSSGLGNRKALYAALTSAGIGVALYYPMLSFWNSVDESWLMMAGLALVAILVGIAVGFAWGGPDWHSSSRAAAITAFLVAFVLFVDRLMQSWEPYVNNDRVKGRPIATIGASTPGIEGSFWILTIDSLTHLLLPTLTLILISFAGYTRYMRASTLEVLNQDYIRTARSKGLTERTVVMRHAFRNALLPLASVVPVDMITVIGGALLTETVFSWFGMGRLFVTSLQGNFQDPVMAYIVLVGIFAIVANFVADLLYAVLDPRIRVNA